MVDFWRRALNVVFKHYWPHIEITLEEIKAVFQHDLRKPFGLDALVQELIARGELIDVMELRALADYKAKTKLSWRGWLLAKVSSLLSEKPAFSGVVASTAKLNEVCRKVEDWVKQRSSFCVVRKVDLVKYLTELVRPMQGYDAADADLVLVKLYCDDLASTIQLELGMGRLELVKIRHNGSLDVSESDQAYVLLAATVEQIEQRVLEHKNIKAKYVAEARSWIALKQMDKAKKALQRGRLVDSYIEQLHNRRHECESQILELSTAEANSSVIDSLRFANQAFKLTQASVDQAQELMEQLEENHGMQTEINTILSTPIVAEDEEALLKELDELDHDMDVIEAEKVILPSVPKGMPKVRPFVRGEAAISPKVRPFVIEQESAQLA